MKQKFILSGILFAGLILTVSIITIFAFLGSSSHSTNCLFKVLMIGTIDYLAGFPIFYHFFFQQYINTSKNTDGSCINIKFPKNILLSLPDKFGHSFFQIWFILIILLAIIGVLCGILCIFLFRIINTPTADPEYLSPYLNGTMIAYFTGSIWCFFNRDTIFPSLKLKHFFNKKTAVSISVCILLVLLTTSISAIILDIRGFVFNVITVVALCSGIIITIILMSVYSDNNKLKSDLHDMNMLVKTLQDINKQLKESNESLQSKKSDIFKKRQDTLNLLCKEYSDKWESEKRRLLILIRINEEISKLRSTDYRKIIESEISDYYGDVFAEIRTAKMLKEDDIYFLQLIISGFSQKSISLISGIHPKNFYTKKYRLVKKIRSSEISNKNYLLSIID